MTGSGVDEDSAPNGSSVDRWCIIGAGPAGLAAAKNLRDQGIEFDVLERHASLGGVWRYGEPGSSVYASTNMISSRRLIEFPGLPMPDTWPDYPSHEQVRSYLERYADRFGIRPHILFGREVDSVSRDRGTSWEVHLTDGSRHAYRGLVIATGHHWEPKVPAFPGQFEGDVLHSGEYRSASILAERRVLVVGGGNSGSDIAVESARIAQRTYQSLRHGYHYLPKYFWGRPMDVLLARLDALHVPKWIRRVICTVISRAVFGDPAQFGLERPRNRMFEGRVVLNSELVHHVASGAVVPKPGIARFEGTQVHFTDGSTEVVDLVVLATGFETAVSFSEAGGEAPLGERMRLHMIDEHHDDVFYIGHIQPSGGTWQLFDAQGAVIAALVARMIGQEGFDLDVRNILSRHDSRTYLPPPSSRRGDHLRVDLFRYASMLSGLRSDLGGLKPTPSRRSVGR